jgi:hypothetical protein
LWVSIKVQQDMYGIVIVSKTKIQVEVESSSPPQKLQISKK